MGVPTPSSPDWGAMGELYDQLAAIERYKPGSDHARDVEDAITLLLDGRTSSSDSRHLRHDAVRRARFLRRQAARQRPAALARLALLAATAPHLYDAERAPGEPYHEITPEAIVCAREMARELARPARRGPAVHAAPVLAGLLADEPPASIAAQLGISRSTVDRCIAGLRRGAAAQLMEAA